MLFISASLNSMEPLFGRLGTLVLIGLLTGKPDSNELRFILFYFCLDRRCSFSKKSRLYRAAKIARVATLAHSSPTQSFRGDSYLWGGGNTSPLLKTTAWEATLAQETRKIRTFFKKCSTCLKFLQTLFCGFLVVVRGCAASSRLCVPDKNRSFRHCR